MAGTIILTGANGSLGIHAAEQLLKAHPEFVTIFTVRNAAESDANTESLRKVIARYPGSRASIHQVDHANLSAIHEFASKISSAITAGEYPPIKSIICNAAYWNLVADSELTEDGYDKTLQVSHIAHVALLLRLIGNFADSGRIVLLSSIGHYRRPNAMTSHLPEIPDNIDQLNHPLPDKDKQGRGFQRYANSKLVATTWMYALDHYLQQVSSTSCYMAHRDIPPVKCLPINLYFQNRKFKNITVVAINPGGLGDSRVFTTNTPRSIQLTQRFILKPFMWVINSLVDPTFRSSADAGVDVAELAVGKARPGERGYFTLLDKDESDPITRDPELQQKVWQKSLEWAKITKDNTALKEAFK
ncbi:WW domain-containing oxidoreductase [Lachnellula willkommii]|uniref:3beta-hydroxysteroid 3-dehydrogenase n=1 Tax=Lachnellula willkommii TaxID=215461 RepID=A0A559LY83_9HELO|nr:WW domain-containing oxidoreductase [Lachnellula willkommii]